MSNEIVHFAYKDMEQMAVSLASSGLFGITDKTKMLALMLISHAEGMHPAIAARDYHIIQGKPSLKADAMLARYQASGGKVEWLEYTDTKVVGKFTHPAGGSIDVAWTIDMAKKAEVYKSSSAWGKYPRAMLRARCVSEGIRATNPGCVVGVYTPEEVEDFTPKVIKDVTPVELASHEQVCELLELIAQTQTPDEVIDRWLFKAKVSGFVDMPADIIQKCIDSLKSKVNES